MESRLNLRNRFKVIVGSVLGFGQGQSHTMQRADTPSTILERTWGRVSHLSIFTYFASIEPRHFFAKSGVRQMKKITVIGLTLQVC